MKESIFIASFSEQLIREKVILDKPDSECYRLIEDYKEDQRDYEQHVASRRTFPYDVKEGQDGKELREGIDFEIETILRDGAEHKKVAIPIEPDKPEQNYTVEKKLKELLQNYNAMNHALSEYGQGALYILKTLEKHLEPTTLQPVKDEGWKEKFEYWLTNNAFVKKAMAQIIVAHVERYIRPVALPAIDGIKTPKEILANIRPMTTIYPGIDNDLIYEAMQAYHDQFALPVQPAGVNGYRTEATWFDNYQAFWIIEKSTDKRIALSLGKTLEESATNSIKIINSLSTPSAVVKDEAINDPLHYFREGYKYHRSFNDKVVPYDEAAELTVQKAFDELKNKTP